MADRPWYRITSDGVTYRPLPARWHAIAVEDLKRRGKSGTFRRCKAPERPVERVHLRNGHKGRCGAYGTMTATAGETTCPACLARLPAVLSKVIDMGISGAQTGVDQAWLAACVKHHVPTGGWMPKGFRTEDGPRPDLALRFGLQECPEAGYPPRTRRNVGESDAVIVIGDHMSRGSRLTRACALQSGVPVLCLSFDGADGTTPPVYWLQSSLAFIQLYRPKHVMGAGNRESGHPGIGMLAFDLFDRMLTQLLRAPG